MAPPARSRAWVGLGAAVLVLLALALLNLVRVTVIGRPATLPAHLAPWATRARTFADLIREEASLRLAGDPRFQAAKNELGPAAAEAKVLPVLIEELEGEVELIRRIEALAQDLEPPPSADAQRRALAAFVAQARQGVLVAEAALEAELLRADPGLPGAPDAEDPAPGAGAPDPGAPNPGAAGAAGETEDGPR